MTARTVVDNVDKPLHPRSSRRYASEARGKIAGDATTGVSLPVPLSSLSRPSSAIVRRVRPRRRRRRRWRRRGTFLTEGTAWQSICSPGKKRARTKKRLARVQGPRFARSFASEQTSILYTQGERERSERASARVHYDSCIYIRSKNIRARCVPAGPARYFIWE